MAVNMKAKVFFSVQITFLFEFSLSFLFLNLSEYGRWGGFARFLAKSIRNEGKDCTCWKGCKVWAQRRRLEQQEFFTPTNEPSSQESSGSDPQGQAHLWISHCCSIYWGGLEWHKSLAAFWPFPESTSTVLGWLCWQEGTLFVSLLQVIPLLFLCVKVWLYRMMNHFIYFIITHDALFCLNLIKF